MNKGIKGKSGQWLFDNFEDIVKGLFLLSFSLMIFGSIEGFALPLKIGAFLFVSLVLAPVAIFFLSAFFRVRR